jgi:uncharacterized protein (DUF58 family)
VKAADRSRPRLFWRRALWFFVWPRRHERIQATVSGAVLIGLSFGIGTAAYNSASNILFIALSLLLACLILSGVLSWLNLRGVGWTLDIQPPLRAGQPAEVGLLLRNEKGFLPTYALWFEFAAAPIRKGEVARPETTLTGKGIDVWAALKKADAEAAAGTVHLRTRLDPRGEAGLSWVFTPPARGVYRLEVRSVGSLFPFGFLRKVSSADLSREVHVWPAPVDYRKLAVAGSRKPSGELQLARAGSEGDMIALRRYESGDSHRIIHWKASARRRRLVVRQFSAQSSEACSLWLRTDADVWSRPEQFELMLGFAATLALDLFHAGRLQAAAIDRSAPVQMKRVADLESFIDRLSEVTPTPVPADSRAPFSSTGRTRLNLLTFEPEGARGVASYIHGTKTAAA